ncbi:Protein Y67A10A.9 [Aphelenchoides avenae]|nr:Protein Y67A10A.9 [Aphelenchus avenae]
MGSSRKRCGWLSFFLLLQVLAFTACLLAVVSPSWQYVYLEDGRTEHHHGLWLDCKRDYSNDYGRPREYYESLYRLDHLQGPFDQFALPPLLCVYKFDYWMDDEDLYEHGYDENRLQDDAHQHLFLGWKIAALTALLFGLVCSLSAIMILFCAFCHRLLICVASVLVSLAVVTYSIGNVVFYMYANYQDNNILKEEDGIYEQYFGWSFYASLIGNGLLLISAVIGCLSTSAVVSFRRAKLVKIEVQEDDNNQLLNSIGSSSNDRITPFKRAYSAVYKIDSSELRKWEREAMRRVEQNNFKRANSMPNIKKGIMRSSSIIMAHSNSDISKAATEPAQRVGNTAHTMNIAVTSGAHCRQDALRDRPLIPEEVVYEYVDPSSISLSSTRMNTLDASQ